MSIASIGANAPKPPPPPAPVPSAKTEAGSQDRAGQPRTGGGAERAAVPLTPAAVRTLFTEAARAGLPAGQAQQVVTAPAPAIAPLAAGLVSALAAQKTGQGAPAEPDRLARAQRRVSRGPADPAKTMGETLSPETVSALIQAVQRRYAPRDDGEDGLAL